MAALDLLKLYYSTLLRVDAPNIPPADLQALTGLAAQVDSGQLTLANAATAVGRLSVGTTEVAVLSYQFFTGMSPTAAGLDYLVAPAGPNPNNLNSAYYSGFNVGNRYINFAVNLGKGGEGTAAFTADFGGLSLVDTLSKAYLRIFGVPPAAGQAEEILNAQVSNGLGGTFTRAEYFAVYGGDGLTGQGTKAALVGWLLSVAATSDVGAYAQAYDAFAMDLAPDAQAIFHSNLVETYGPSSEGNHITVAHDQSVSLTAADPALRSTNGDDVVQGTTGLDTPQSVQTGGGDDQILITGNMAGLVDAGSGNDLIVVESLRSPVAILGGGPNGMILAGDGDDTIELTGMMQPGAQVHGGAGYDTLRSTTYAPFGSHAGFGTQVTGIEHMVLGSDVDFFGVTGLQSLETGELRPGVPVQWSNVPAGTPILMNSTGVTGLAVSFRPGTVDAQIEIAGLQGYPYGHRAPGQGASAWDDATVVGVGGATGTLRVQVDSDTVIGTLGFNTGHTIVLTGAGRLTSALSIQPLPDPGAHSRFDASASGGVDIVAYNPLALSNDVVLSAHDDTFLVNLQNPYETTFTLGAGADTLSISGHRPTVEFSLTNMVVANGAVTTYARVLDFEKGVDHLELGPVAVITPGAQAFVTGAATLEQALIALSPHLAAQGVTVFEFGGDTWVYRQNGNIGVDTGDGLIRLVGVTGLSVAQGAASGDIHWGAA